MEIITLHEWLKQKKWLVGQAAQDGTNEWMTEENFEHTNTGYVWKGNLSWS